eukprot:Pompholyxophrys_punicea_v1_NODE_132_length_3289_cov_13.374652.p2 type:complete len:451 gc:universal NODE_132_length_3289_cov_13.374652:185-1537(+)
MDFEELPQKSSLSTEARSADESSESSPSTEAQPADKISESIRINYFPFPSRTFALIFFWYFLVAPNISDVEMRSLLHVISDPGFRSEDVPSLDKLKSVHLKGDFPRFSPTVCETNDGRVFLNSFRNFVTFFLGIPGTLKDTLVLRNISNVAKETIDGTKAARSPFFWAKSIPFQNDFLFIGDVVSFNSTVTEKMFLIKEFVFVNGIRHIRGQVLVRAPMLLSGLPIGERRWLLTSFEDLIPVENVVFVSEIPEIFPMQLINRAENESPDLIPTDLSIFCKYRQSASGKPYFTFPFTLFTDEWGGSKRGKFNKFESVYCTLSFLPRQMKNLTFWTWHVASSNIVNFVPLFNTVLSDLKKFATFGVDCYVADLNAVAHINGDLFQVVADNRVLKICVIVLRVHTLSGAANVTEEKAMFLMTLLCGTLMTHAELLMRWKVHKKKIKSRFTQQD